MKRIVFLLFAAVSISCAQESEQISLDNSPLFDTQFLLQYAQVTNLLKNYGFQEGFFSTPDNHKLNYLYLERPNADYTVVLCAGWLPGRKEGLATFYALLPETCNILFFDARGHGASEGALFRNAWIYGKHEYKDVIGALNFAHERTKKPIVLYGVCAGAFNAAHALIHLQKQKSLDQYQIKGFIFDSGWASLPTASWTAPMAKINEFIAKFWAILYGKKWKEVLTSIPFRVSSYALTKILSVFHTIFFFPAYAVQNATTNLFDKIEQLPLPIFYIHSHDDDYVPIEHAQYLAAKSKNAQTWWIEKPSKHACHCLKHKDEYQEKIRAFIIECMDK